MPYSIGSTPKLLGFKSFHDGACGNVQYNGSMSKAFDIKNGMKQGCVLAPTLFNIFFSVLLKHAFRSTDEDIQLRTRSERKLFNSVSLQVKTKVCKAMLHDFLFAVDAAFAAHKLLSILCLQREHLTLRH